MRPNSLFLMQAFCCDALECSKMECAKIFPRIVVKRRDGAMIHRLDVIGTSLKFELPVTDSARACLGML